MSDNTRPAWFLKTSDRCDQLLSLNWTVNAVDMLAGQDFEGESVYREILCS
jgi:hypothetical protein